MHTFLALVALVPPLQPPTVTAPAAAALPEFTVRAIRETEPVEATGDAADDPAIWIHPSDSTRSIVLGTNKRSGLAVYSLTGQEIQFLPVGRVNNVDAAPVPGGDTVVMTGQRDSREVFLWWGDNVTRRLKQFEPAPRKSLSPGVVSTTPNRADSILEVGVDEPYGLACGMVGNTLRLLVNDKSGVLEDWSISITDRHLTAGGLNRTLRFDSQTEGMVIDTHHGWAFVGEEARGIWKISMDSASTEKTLVDSATTASPSGHLVADIEGLTIADAGQGEGYLICSNQGNNSFTVYTRAEPHTRLARFRIEGSEGIDGVTETDGIAVTTADLGGPFAAGLFVAQDGENTDAEGMAENQNFKFVAWSEIQKGLDEAAKPK